jgi:hypothetical protein
MTTQKQIRSSFWETFPKLKAYALKSGTKIKPQNSQPVAIRTAFCDFVEMLASGGTISQELAGRVTL